MTLAFADTKVSSKHLYPAAKIHSARELYGARFSAALTTALALNDLIGLLVLPPRCLPFDLHMYLPDLDSGGTPTLAFDVGILNSAQDDLVAGSLLIDGSTVGQAAGIQRVNDYEGIWDAATWLAQSDCPSIDSDRIIAMKVVTAAATPVAGTIRGCGTYISSEYGV